MPNEIITTIPSPNSVIDTIRARRAKEAKERIADSVSSMVKSFKDGETSYFEHRLLTQEEAYAVAKPFIISGYDVFYRKKDVYLCVAVPRLHKMKRSPLFFLSPFTIEHKYYFRKMNIDGTLTFTRYKR